MSTETTNKKIKIDNGTTFGRTYTDKAVDERLQGLVSTTTFTPVKEKANNSLQKPTGLTKTKLVGVGTNGQENIEIGDNLTLANGKLSATGGGGGGSTPARHGYTIFVTDSCVDNYNLNSTFHYEIYTTKNYNLPIGTENAIADFLTNDDYKELRAIGSYPAAGYFAKYTTVRGTVWKYKITDTKNIVYIYRNENSSSDYNDLNKPTFTVVQLF